MKSIKYMMISLLLLGVAMPSMAEKAYFAGGCFWCVESDFEQLEGVTEVISGFTGGTLENPTYSGNHEGHYEAGEVHYDPSIISYKELLDFYWRHIDPFDAGGQFCDRGFSYLSAVFVANDEERALAEQTKAQIQALFPDDEVVTPILDASTFYPIAGEESYHQDYYKNYAARYKYYRWSCGRDARIESIWSSIAQ